MPKSRWHRCYTYFEAAMIKMLQQATMNMLKTTEKIGSLSKEVESLSKEKEDIKKYNNQSKKLRGHTW